MSSAVGVSAVCAWRCALWVVGSDWRHIDRKGRNPSASYVGHRRSKPITATADPTAGARRRVGRKPGTLPVAYGASVDRGSRPMKAARRSQSSAPRVGGTSAPKGTPGPTMLRYSGLIMARAPSSAGEAREESNMSICPVALARSQACARVLRRTCPRGWPPCTPPPTASCAAWTSGNRRPMLAPPVVPRHGALRARRRVPRAGTHLRAEVPAHGRVRLPGGPLRRGGRSVRPRHSPGHGVGWPTSSAVIPEMMTAAFS